MKSEDSARLFKDPTPHESQDQKVKAWTKGSLHEKVNITNSGQSHKSYQ